MSSTQNSLEAGGTADAGGTGVGLASASPFLSQVAFDGRGLVVVVAQDDASGEVLMVAWANGEALTRTLETGFGHYFSRSRNNLWKKGETSGHVQRVVSIHLDCDGDTVIYRVEQEGPACHTGAPTCFFRVWDGSAWVGSAESPSPCPAGSGHGGHRHGDGVTHGGGRDHGGSDGEPA